MGLVRYEVAVVGGGLAGATAALAFADAGFDTLLLSPERRPDGRSTALIGPSISLLNRLGVLTALSDRSQPMSAMRLIDDTRRLLRAPTIEFRAAEIALPYFGLNVLNRDLLDAIDDRIRALSDRLTVVSEAVESIDLREEAAHVRTSTGRELACRLLIGSDGRNSMVRTHAGIPVRTWRYPQVAIVMNFSHEREHEGVSTEFHTPTGPFTQVPLPGRRSSLVWVEDPRTAELIVDLPPERLSMEVERRLHSTLGKVEVEGAAQSFPLSGGSTERLTAQRCALVGEAAHVFPPIGAQGLNLGLRDVESVLKAALMHRDDPGGRAMLLAYEQERRIDVATRATAVDLLNRSLLTDFLPVQAIRALGLSSLAAFPFLRQAFMREGVEPGSALRSYLRGARAHLPGGRASG